MLDNTHKTEVNSDAGCLEYIKTVTHDEFITRFKLEGISKINYPHQASFEITHKCNLNCRHCYLPPSWRESKKEELDYHEVCDIIDQLVDNEVLWLCFTGGEVFMRKDFLEAYKYAVDKGIVTIVFTNGTLINKSIVNTLKKFPPYIVEITLHSLIKDTFEGITQVPGSFEKCIRGIELLHKEKIPIKLKTVVMRDNAHNIEKIKEYAGRLDAEYSFDTTINSCLDGCKEPGKMRLSPGDILDLELKFRDRYKEWEKICDRYKKIGEKKPSKIHNCGAVYTSVSIDPYGTLGLCTLSRDTGISLKEDSYAVGLKKLRRLRPAKFRKNSACANCNLSMLCDLCPPVARLESGENKPVEYFCELAKLRYENFAKRSI